MDTDLEKAADDLNRETQQLYYKLSSNPLGYCLIMNNVIFETRRSSTPSEDENRYGSDVDVKSLTCFFEYAGFQVIVEQNMKAGEMVDYLKEFAKREDLATVDSMIVIIMSHGAERNGVDIIYGTDWNYIRKADVRDFFNNSNCKLLQNKPKVFIFVSCRGEGMDYGVYCENVDSGCKSRSMEYDIRKDLSNPVSFDARDTIIKSTITDTFFVHSALPCQKSQRHHENGTIFCQTFIEVLNKYFKIHDLHTIINFVNRKLAGKISPTFHTVQSAHYESIGATKSFKFCGC